MDTLTGYTPEVGDIVWQQMYSPVDPHHTSTIEERIEAGHQYGRRRIMRVAGIVENHGRPDGAGRPRTRWHLVDVDRPNDESRMSWVENDWCVLEPAHTAVGMLF